ncbi:hypothetical protein B0181_02225 [Moraxella caviae]|uniref:D-alanyl-D-alanine carboxypeptidase n=1 Tax=Moraxella caviae TaxID=34060 RepID=A0A1T0A992_9GAMM|nr:M15 family metallopeptidase [Moraxella caviae]OOR91871.1 hypothetical protein B0181_02225 [Moraxella caviae]STZ09720.1 D-alanyl-D-alanine carboxypeptidase [Moraxella caviae]
MQKRTRDFLIGGSLMAIGAGMLAHASSGFVVTDGKKELGPAANTKMSAPKIVSSEQGPTIQQPTVDSISATTEQSKAQFRNEQPNNANFATPANLTNTASSATGPAANRLTQPMPVTEMPVHTPQLSHVSEAKCAPEALAVGIKHFRYADASSSDLVWSGYGSRNDAKYKIHREAKDALQELVRAAKQDGVTLTPGSIFRSSARQRQIVNNKKNQGQSARQIYYTSSHPGFSEHHTGLAVDFTPIDHGFAKSAGYRWLKQNAHRYGWHQTFTEDYKAYSGVSVESWHWRYEGKNQEFAHIFAASKSRLC